MGALGEQPQGGPRLEVDEGLHEGELEGHAGGQKGVLGVGARGQAQGREHPRGLGQGRE